MANRVAAPANPDRSSSLELPSRDSEVIVGESDIEQPGNDDSPLLPATAQDPEKSQWSTTITLLIPKHRWLSSSFGAYGLGGPRTKPKEKRYRRKCRQYSRRRECSQHSYRRKCSQHSELPNDESDSDAKSIRLGTPPSASAVSAQLTETAESQTEQHMFSPSRPEVAGLPTTCSKFPSDPLIFPWMLDGPETIDFSMCSKATRSCGDSGYSTHSMSELNVDVEAGK